MNNIKTKYRISFLAPTSLYYPDDFNCTDTSRIETLQKDLLSALEISQKSDQGKVTVKSDKKSKFEDHQIWGANFLTFPCSISDVIIIGGVLIDLVVFKFGFFVRFDSNFSLITFFVIFPRH